MLTAAAALPFERLRSASVELAQEINARMPAYVALRASLLLNEQAKASQQSRRRANSRRNCIPKGHALCMPQMVTRIDKETARAVDELVADGVVASRSEAVRLGLRVLLERHRRARIGEAIVEGYGHRPQTAAEVGWADAATVAMITEDSW